MENWVDVKGYEGIYMVSNYGKVKSLHGNGRILKERYDKRGYVQYVLYRNGEKKSVAIWSAVRPFCLELAFCNSWNVALSIASPVAGFLYIRGIVS